MITEAERQEVEAALGAMPRRPGLAEELIAGTQVTILLGQLFEQMEIANLKQADVARAMGVHRRQVLRWFSGESAIKAETLIALGRHVGCQFDARWQPMQACDDWAASMEVSCASTAAHEVSKDLAEAA